MFKKYKYYCENRINNASHCRHRYGGISADRQTNPRLGGMDLFRGSCNCNRSRFNENKEIGAISVSVINSMFGHLFGGAFFMLGIRR